MRITVPAVAKLDVRPGGPLPWTPRLDVSGLSVMVGPYRDGAEHEKHVLDTIGSGNWYQAAYDEMRFDKTSSLLSSLWSHIPEQPFDQPTRLSAWTRLTPEPGAVQLAEPTRFELPPTEQRWCSASGDLLAWLYPDLPAEPVDPKRIRIAEALDLLTAGDRLYGYLLAEPARFLTAGWAAADRNADPQISELLAAVFETITYSNAELMQDQDASMLEQLQELRQRITSTAGDTEKGRILRDHIEDLIDNFY